MIEPKTKQALATCSPLLDAVARERVGIELEGILSTGHGGDAMLRYPELICAAVPELAPARGFASAASIMPLMSMSISLAC